MLIGSAMAEHSGFTPEAGISSIKRQTQRAASKGNRKETNRIKA